MNQIVVRDGKGAKDRITILPIVAKPALTQHLQRVKRQHDADLARGAGWVELPWALTRKYPNAGREWPWQWVFPATRFYVDRATGQRRRHHLHESVVQRSVVEAGRRVRLAKRATPHTFATRSRRISWKTARTSVPCKSSWVTMMSARLRSTRTS